MNRILLNTRNIMMTKAELWQEICGYYQELVDDPISFSLIILILTILMMKFVSIIY